PSRTDFYLPVKALSKIFKAKFRDQMKQAPLFDQISSEVWYIDWNVDSQAVPCSEACLKYLAPYVFKVAISNSRILKVEDRTVLICYKKPHSNRLRTLPLEIMEFIRRFLQHVLPTGFMKVRYFGFMNPNCEVSLDRIRALIKLRYGFSLVLPKVTFEPRPPITCPSCGGPLKLRFLTAGNTRFSWRHRSKDRHRLGSFRFSSRVTSCVDWQSRARTNPRPEGVPRPPILQLDDLPKLAQRRRDNLRCRGLHADVACGTHREREPTPVAEREAPPNKPMKLTVAFGGCWKEWFC